MSQELDPQAMLREILSKSADPAALIRGAIGEEALGGGSAQSQLNLLIAADPNVATYLRKSMPTSVQEHLRYVPTLEVTFKDGSFGGEAVSINVSDFDAELHDKVEAGSESGENKSRRQRNSAQ